MNRHASLNRTYRLVWNDALGAYVPAAETARGRGKSNKRKLFALAGAFYATLAHAGPIGGQVTAGNGNITQAGSTTTIQQSSQNLSLSWQSFNVGSQETVDFVQPNSTAIAVNRILDPNGSVILGHLDANGQVYLINPNGVLFGKGAEVNVGGLVASALALTPDSGGASAKFSGSGSGSVVNEGTITAVGGGSVALLGNHVGNTGIISAQLGSVALGAGSAATLTFNGTRLVSLQVDQAVLNSEASNGGLIRADGGTVLMTAGAQKSLLASVVNNTGIIEARTVESHQGAITLLGGMSAGTVQVNGTLDTTAPTGGNGGLIETSAAQVNVANGARITTAAAMGLNGTWTIDPTDFTISTGTTAQTGSGIGATTLQTELANGNVAIATSGSGSEAGYIYVNAPVSWSANKLTLTSASDIDVNAAMTMTGTSTVDFEPGSGILAMGFAPNGSFAGHVDISSGAVDALTISGQVYTVINSVGTAADATTAPSTPTLQGMAAASNRSGYFALGSNIDASTTSGWNSGAGFTPIGNFGVTFNGTFDGLGHTVTNLVVNQPTANFVGMFGFVDFGGELRNIGLVGGSVSGTSWVGQLAGFTYGDVIDSYSTGTVTAAATGQYIGGLAGNTYGSVINSHATGAINAGANTTDVGGLVGDAAWTVSQSYATGSVTGGLGSQNVGGLVGLAASTTATSYATGAVSGGNYVGGLVGRNYGAVSLSHATGNVTGSNSNVGGLIGEALASVTSSYATGTVSGANYVGGLLGKSNASATVSQSFATGAVTGARYTGGLVGMDYGSIANTYATGNVIGTLNVGGLVGIAISSSVSNSYATGSVSGGNFVGALVGAAYGTITNSFYNSATNSSSGLTGLGANSASTPDVAGTVMGLTAAQLQNQATFTTATAANGNVNPNWDFGATWTLYAGHTNPLLQVFMTPLTVSGTVSQTYNGAAFAPTVGNLSYSVPNPDTTHLFGTVTVTGSAVGAVHAGSYTFTPGGLYSDQLGYLISYSSSSLTIDPATLTVTGTAAGKVYDGTTVAPLTGGALVGLVTGDVVTLTQAGTFASKNAGTGIAVTVGDTLGGASAGDYTLVEPTGVTGSITPAPLTVSGTTVGTRVYDGTTVAPLSGGSLLGLVSGDTVTLAQAGTFASKNVGTGVAVTAADSLGGTDAGNYTITEPTGLSGSITPASLTVSGTTVGEKVYNGTTVAPLSGGSLVGLVTGDTVTLTQAGSFASKNAGTGIAVTATDSLSGTDASDYSLVEPTGLTGSIVPAGSSAGSTGAANAWLQTALDARTQIVQNLLYPALGANPQAIAASPTIQTPEGTQQATTVTVSMKIGATGTLKIENGGLRLPSNLVVGNE